MAASEGMKLGVHLAERARLGHLGPSGLVVPEPWMGILDCLRMVEGHLPEPEPGRPLGLVGLDALLMAVGDESTPLLKALRTGLVQARRYFDWKKIPVALLVDGTVDDPADGTGLVLTRGERRWPLAPLLGTRLEPALSKTNGWWWAPQIG